jgi:hypothetical protein
MSKVTDDAPLSNENKKAPGDRFDADLRQGHRHFAAGALQLARLGAESALPHNLTKLARA